MNRTDVYIDVDGNEGKICDGISAYFFLTIATDLITHHFGFHFSFIATLAYFFSRLQHDTNTTHDSMTHNTNMTHDSMTHDTNMTHDSMTHDTNMTLTCHMTAYRLTLT